MLWNNLFLGYEILEGDELYIYLARENSSFEKPKVKVWPEIKKLQTLDYKELVVL